MAQCDRSFFRVLLTLSIILTTILITIATSQSIKPWSSNATFHGNDTSSDYAHVRTDSGTIAEDAFREDLSSLHLVHILFRHGDRAPTHFYPTDPHKHDWPLGAGELTQQGMLQGYQLGQYLRHHYNDFLGNTLNLNEVYIRSVDLHHTINSAECVATGLFPANFSNTAWKLGRWQPVPVHTFPAEGDTVLSPCTACKYVDDLYNGLVALYDSKQTLLKDKELMFHLSQHTEMEMNVKSLHQLSDNIYYVKVHGMTLPSWLTKEVEQKLIAHHFSQPSFLEEQARYLAGMLLQDMLSNMDGRINDFQDKHKMYLYSGNDLNIHALMSLLQVYDEEQILDLSASALIIELHRKDDNYFIRVLYKTDDSQHPKVLIVPGCVKKLCPLARFRKLYGELIQEDWDQVCGEETQEKFIDFGEQTVPILISVLVFLLIMDLILLYKACIYHSKLKQLPYRDEYSLVQTQQDSNDEEEEETVLNHVNHHHHSSVQNGGGRISHLKRGRLENSYKNRNYAEDDTYSSSDSDSCEETTLFMSRHKSSR